MKVYPVHHADALSAEQDPQRPARRRNSTTHFVPNAVPGEKLLDEAKALAAHVAQFKPAALDWCKKALDQIPSHFADWSVALAHRVAVESTTLLETKP